MLVSLHLAGNAGGHVRRPYEQDPRIGSEPTEVDYLFGYFAAIVGNLLLRLCERNGIASELEDDHPDVLVDIVIRQLGGVEAGEDGSGAAPHRDVVETHAVLAVQHDTVYVTAAGMRHADAFRAVCKFEAGVPYAVGRFHLLSDSLAPYVQVASGGKECEAVEEAAGAVVAFHWEEGGRSGRIVMAFLSHYAVAAAGAAHLRRAVGNVTARRRGAAFRYPQGIILVKYGEKSGPASPETDLETVAEHAADPVLLYL